MISSLPPEHLISARTLTINEIKKYIEIAEEFKELNYTGEDLKGNILINLFYEPSTRTQCSFHAAMLRLGGKVITVNEEFSSIQKGESFNDTIKTLSLYGNILVIRSPQKEAAKLASNVSEVPVINAGDGTGEHPTQALLDMFTIKTELEKYNINIYSDRMIYITFVGDLKNSRTVHSLIYMLCLFPNMIFNYVCPTGLDLPDELINYVTSKHISQNMFMSLEEAIKKTDVLYVTRIQKERFSNEEEYNYAQKNKSYKINNEILQQAKKEMIIMHPLPRIDEIAEEVDDDPRAVYFEQVKNGLFMRMAILYTFL